MLPAEPAATAARRHYSGKPYGVAHRRRRKPKVAGPSK